MDDIYRIFDYFPIQPDEQTVLDYTAHHRKHLEACCTQQLFASAFIHIHLSYMTFIYLQLKRIAKEKQEVFRYSWILSSRDEKNFLQRAANTTTFAFSCLNEKTVFRLFRLVDFDDDTIGNLSKFIDWRNDAAHATGKIQYAEVTHFEKILTDYMGRMEETIAKQERFLKEIYRKRLRDINFEEDYQIANDDLETEFIIPLQLSINEIKMIMAWNMKDKASQAFKEFYGD